MLIRRTIVNTINTTRTLSVATLALLLAACNTMPDRNNALEHARTHLQSAQQDPQLASLAADELKRATESLARADQAYTKGAPIADVDHLSYLADQRVTIAQETASSRAAQATVAGASADRDKLRLAKRTQEADTAQAQLAAAQITTQRGSNRINELEQQLSDMGAKKTDHGMVVTLGGVLFYTGQANLLPAARHDLRKLADFLKHNPQRTALIEGNTDNVGSANANMDLSQRRADAVKTALIELGVTGDRLRTGANGEDKPVATNATAAGRQMNRRVEVIFAPEHDTASAM